MEKKASYLYCCCCCCCCCLLCGNVTLISKGGFTQIMCGWLNHSFRHSFIQFICCWKCEILSWHNIFFFLLNFYLSGEFCAEWKTSWAVFVVNFNCIPGTVFITIMRDTFSHVNGWKDVFLHWFLLWYGACFSVRKYNIVVYGCIIDNVRLFLLPTPTTVIK